jgi:predicted transcriptional regulator
MGLRALAAVDEEAMVSERPKAEVLQMTVAIVAAYVAHNTVEHQELGTVIRQVHGALVGLAGTLDLAAREEAKPAVSIKRSVTPDYLVCLEDGKKFKSLKRHLRSHYNLSPEEYREKWGLPHDYPMVAPNYAEARSKLAKKMGLGTRRQK